MAETNNLASLLRDFAQGASNSAATNLSIPIDVLAWGLRKAGLNIPSNPVGGSDWLAEKGFTPKPKNELAGLLGDVAGFAAPLAAVTKAPQIAKGLLQAGENLAKPNAMANAGQRGAITYHASPVKLDLKDRYGKGYGELYDLVNGEASNALSMEKYDAFRSLLKKYENGNLGNNAGKKADQLYVSNQPDAWKSVQVDELNVPYDLGGIYGLEVNKAPSYYMQKSGMGQQLPEAVIDAKDVLNQFGPFKNKAELDKHLASIGKLDDAKTVSNGNERLLKILERNGESAAPAFNYPQSEALKLAQQRAALPTSEGGLGLPANNTAMDRAISMGFDPEYEALHGTIAKTNFKQFKAGENGYDELGKGVYFVDDPSVTNLYSRGEGGRVIPAMIPKEGYFDKAAKPDFRSLAEKIVKNDGMPTAAKDWQSAPLDDFADFIKNTYPSNSNEWLKRAGYIGAESSGKQQIAGQKVVFNPDDIRSRFAAFDPWRRNAAIAASMGVAAPDLLANPLNDENNRLIEILKRQTP